MVKPQCRHFAVLFYIPDCNITDEEHR